MLFRSEEVFPKMIGKIVEPSKATLEYIKKNNFVRLKDWGHFASMPNPTRYLDVGTDGSYREITDRDYFPPDKVSVLISIGALYGRP